MAAVGAYVEACGVEERTADVVLPLNLLVALPPARHEARTPLASRAHRVKQGGSPSSGAFPVPSSGLQSGCGESSSKAHVNGLPVSHDEPMRSRGHLHGTLVSGIKHGSSAAY